MTEEYKLCIKCRVVKPLDEFYIYNPAKHKRRGTCNTCVSTQNRRRELTRHGPCKDCGKAITTFRSQTGRCRKCNDACRRAATEAKPVVWKLNRHGYMMAKVKHNGATRWYSQHRYVMEQHLGRKLLRHESVHHLNGERADNSIENLELWSSSHPAGQRVDDLVTWAKAILDQYT